MDNNSNMSINLKNSLIGFLQFSLITSLSFLVASCGGGDGNGNGNSTNVFENIDEFHMESILRFNRKYYRASLLLVDFNSPLSGILSRAQFIRDPCELKSSTATFFKNADNTFSLSEQIIGSPCTFSDPNNPSSTATVQQQSKISIIDFILMSSNATEVDLTGKSMVFVENSIEPSYWSQLRLSYNMSEASTVTQSGITVQVNRNESYAIQSTQDANKPCLFVASIFTDCSIIIIDASLSTANSQAINSSEKVIYQYKNIDFSNSSTLSSFDYLPSGQIDFSVNNWSGIISFSGANSRPTFTASNGAKVVTGEL